MSLTSTQKHLVQTSFLQIIDEIAFASQTFYDRLFELDPSLKTLFKEDKTVQGRKLLQALLMIVNGLDNLDTLTPAIHNLGKRHIAYGVQRPHYDTLELALLEMLESCLKDQFTPETRLAWRAAYELIVTVATEDVSLTASSPDRHAEK